MVSGGGLELVGISKRFGAVKALNDVSLSFKPGEVHAVLGENGAGKSTLVNVMAGLTAPDSGHVIADGRELPAGDPVASRRAGLGVVHQHFTLVPSLSAAENIALFRMRTAPGRFDVAALAAPALERAKTLGWTLEPDAKAESLPVGAKQRIEILKSICDDEPFLLFDEPTAPLSPDEVEDLLRILRRLADEGRVVVLVAHKLKEVLAVADRVSVLRRGEVQAAGLAARDITADQLATLMVGELPHAKPLGARATSHGGLVAQELTVPGDSGAPAVRRVSFSARRGEIIGIGGVDGNGQVELAEAIAGIRPFRGDLTFDGGPVRDVAYIPADRHADGLALEMDVADNLLLGRLRSWPRRREVEPWARELIEKFEVKTSGPAQAAVELSGGNQQKLIVARTLDREPDLVVAVNPTRGLDVKATAFVCDQLRAARDRGAAVVLISADLDELFEVADQVSFMSAGALSPAQSAASLVGGTP